MLANGLLDNLYFVITGEHATWESGFDYGVRHTLQYVASAGVSNEKIAVKELGILLIVFGLALVVWGGFGFKTRTRIFDGGPLQVTKETEHSVPYRPLVGGLIAVGGVFLLMKSKSNR